MQKLTENEWIVVKKNKKNSFNPNHLKMTPLSNKITLDKHYIKSNKKIEEIE